LKTPFKVQNVESVGAETSFSHRNSGMGS